jgi:hypothetical protein
MTHPSCHPRPSQSRRGATLVAVLAAMAVVLLMVGGMLKIALLGRRQFLKELELRPLPSGPSFVSAPSPAGPAG